MVAHLVRLKLTLLRNGLRRSPWQVVGLVFAAAYGLFALFILGAGLVGLSGASLPTRSTVFVLAGALLVLGWWVIPLFAFGVDATLDPDRFALFPVPRRQLLTGLTLGALIGIPGVITTVLALASAVVWRQEPAALLVTPVAAVVALATCVVGERAVIGVAGPLLERRRVREAMAGVALLAVVLIGPTMSALTSASTSSVESSWPGLARVVGWTPLGLPWAVPVDVAHGSWLSALARLALSLIVLLALALVWDRSLNRSLTEPASRGSTAKAAGLGWFGRVPATPVGAVAARCLTYWRRDSRYLMAVIVVPIVPVVIAAANPHGPAVLMAAPFAGFLLGWSISADVSYDGSAFAAHVAAPLRGDADRWGRALVVLGLGVPVVILMAVASAWYADTFVILPANVGLGLGLMLTSVGVASVLSSLYVYRVQQAGESPFGTRQGASFAAVVGQFAGWFAVGLLGAPTIVLGVLAIARGSVLLSWVCLLVGLVVGTVVLVAGVRFGGRTLDRRAPELLQQLRSFT